MAVVVLFFLGDKMDYNREIILALHKTDADILVENYFINNNGNKLYHYPFTRYDGKKDNKEYSVFELEYNDNALKTISDFLNAEENKPHSILVVGDENNDTSRGIVTKWHTYDQYTNEFIDQTDNNFNDLIDVQKIVTLNLKEDSITQSDSGEYY